MKFRVYSILIVLVMLLSYTNISQAVEVEKELQESVKVNDGMAFQLEHADGHVTITPWEKDVVNVEVTYHYQFTGIGVNEDDYDFQLEVLRKGNTVVIRGVEERPKRQLLVSTKRNEYTYKISAPAYLFLDIQGEDGNVTVRNWRNDITNESDDGSLLLSDIRADEVNVSSNDGDMFLTNINGDLQVQSDDGELEFNNIRGNITLEINDGDVKLTEVQGTIRVKADDGNITLSDSEIQNSSIRTNDGSVTVGNSSGNFNINSDDARIRIDGVRASRLDIETGDGDIWTYLMSNDNMSVNIRTGDGDVELRLAKDVSAEIILETDGGSIDQELMNISEVRQGEDWFTGILNDGGGSIRVDTEDGDIHVQEGL